MAVYIPTIQTPYFLEGLFSEPKWARMIASGVVDPNTIASAFGSAKQGDYVNIPLFVQAADFARANISSAVDLTFTAASTNDDKAVVLRDASTNEWKKHDEIRTGEDFFQLMSKTAGNKMAKRMLGQLSRVLWGAISAVDSPTANMHIEDQTGSAITVNMIRAAKARMADQGVNLTTAFIHSHVWYDLVKDLQGYNNLDLVGAEVVRSAALQEIMGIANWIVSDDIVTTSAGFDTDDDDVYPTYLLGPGSVYFAYQHEPEFETDQNIVKPSTLQQLKISMDYVIHCRGVAWNSTSNPSDSDLAGANWTQKSPDPRDIRAVLLKSAGQSGKV